MYKERADTTDIPKWIRQKKCPGKKAFLSGKRIFPKGITGSKQLADIVDNTFLAYNAGRLRDACVLFTEKILCRDVTVGMSIAGALTPAGDGASCIVPLIQNGFVDWIVSTGANIYHDLHFAFDKPLCRGTHLAKDAKLKKNNIVRIYDIFLGYTECLMATDNILKSIILQKEFQKEMGTAEFHYLLGKYADEAERQLGTRNRSILAAAYRCSVPVYTSAPGDSSIGMQIAGQEIRGSRLRIDTSRDVNETAAIVLGTKAKGEKSAVFLAGGGSPKNFILQTEPHIQEILKIKEKGHDYFLQITDARPDTGGLSGATPGEAVSWGKVNPDTAACAVVCYTDVSIALPIITSYALSRRKKRRLKRLYNKREKLLEILKRKFSKNNPKPKISRCP